MDIFDEIKGEAKEAISEIASEVKDIKESIQETGENLFENVKNVSEGFVSSAAIPENDKVDKESDEDGYVHNKEEMIFQSGEALQQVVNVVNEAAEAVNDETRTIRESSIPDVLAGALGASVGGVGSFAALYGLGTVGLSAAGITSALATAGAVIGGGMVAGVFVLAAPIAALSASGVALASSARRKQLKQEKERLYKEALLRHEAIIDALKKESKENKERMDYLQTLNVLLQRAIEDLQKDLGIDVA